MTRMAILQDVDKCMRCNGCVLSCKRTWEMKNETIGVHAVAYDQRMAIKSQKRVDMGPFIRFSCWHCADPPCVKRCPFDALAKQDSGAVSIDPTLCNPASPLCTRQCVTDCQRGGFPKVGIGSFAYGTSKAWKCTLCHGRAGVVDAALTAKYGQPLPTRATSGEITAVPEKAHEPACVFTCPAKAMEWDTLASIWARVGSGNTNGYISWVGGPDGSVIWASKKYYLAAPKSDPLIEDHISPMVADILSGPFAKAALVPTLIAGGLLALGARKAASGSMTEGSVS